jgi:hypothetical protein
MQGVASRKNHRNPRNDNRRAMHSPAWLGLSHLTHVSVVTCDSENAYRYWVCHTCHIRWQCLGNVKRASHAIHVRMRQKTT